MNFMVPTALIDSAFNVVATTNGPFDWITFDEPHGVLGLDLAPIASSASTVASRLLFYNQSAFDGSTAGVDPLDDSAISNKVAYLPGGAASTNAATAFTHASNYTKSINGVMDDLTDSGHHASK